MQGSRWPRACLRPGVRRARLLLKIMCTQKRTLLPPCALCHTKKHADKGRTRKEKGSKTEMTRGKGLRGHTRILRPIFTRTSIITGETAGMNFSILSLGAGTREREGASRRTTHGPPMPPWTQSHTSTNTTHNTTVGTHTVRILSTCRRRTCISQMTSSRQLHRMAQTPIRHAGCAYVWCLSLLRTGVSGPSPGSGRSCFNSLLTATCA